jgi:hypothetical protein
MIEIVWILKANGKKEYHRSSPGIRRDSVVELLREAIIKANASGGTERDDDCDRYHWPSHGKSR